MLLLPLKQLLLRIQSIKLKNLGWELMFTN